MRMKSENELSPFTEKSNTPWLLSATRAVAVSVKGFGLMIVTMFLGMVIGLVIGRSITRILFLYAARVIPSQ